jgi:hypothetical protein
MQTDVCIDPYSIITGATGADQFRAVVAMAIAASCGFPATPGTYAGTFCAYKTHFLLDYNSKRW